MSSADNDAHCLMCGMEGSDNTPVVFRDELWAAEVVPGMEIPGWFVLRARRHVELITGLTDSEADTLGRRTRELVAAVQEVTGAPAVYQMAFGETHKHFHVLVTARGERVPADRRSGEILKLLQDGHRNPQDSMGLVPDVRAAYERISGGSALNHHPVDR